MGRIGAGVLVAVAIVVVVVEGGWRCASPSPRYQIVRNGRVVLEDAGGVPVWQDPEAKNAWRTACLAERPSARRVAVFGSSIFYGSGVERDEVFTHVLQARLDAEREETCVVNFAQPGYGLAQKLVMAERKIPELSPAVVVMEVWANDTFAYRFLGESAYALRDATVDDEGYPVAWPMPGALHHWLFRHSRAYEYAALATVPKRSEVLAWDDVMRAEVLPGLERLEHLCRAQGCALILLPAPRLDRPFAEQAAGGDYRVVGDWAVERGIAVRLLADLFADQDYQAIRLDPCCHYNGAGHRVLGERVAAPVLEALRPRAP